MRRSSSVERAFSQRKIAVASAHTKGAAAALGPCVDHRRTAIKHRHQFDCQGRWSRSVKADEMLPKFILGILLLAGIAILQAAQAKRVALVIGNSAYQRTAELQNPRNDATDMAAALKSLGFEVVEGFDLDKPGMDRKVRDFSVALSGADTGVFYFAGHGLQVNGSNFLVPVDAELSTAAALEFEMVRLDLVQRLMEAEAKTNILFLDACRNNPLSRNLARAMGTRAAGIGSGPGGRRIGRRHADQLRDSARERGAGRGGSQLAVRFVPRQAHCYLDGDAYRHSRRRAQRRDGGNRAQTGAVGTLGTDGTLLLQGTSDPAGAAPNGAKRRGRGLERGERHEKPGHPGGLHQALREYLLRRHGACAPR